MQYGLSLIVAFIFLYWLLAWIPIIPFGFGVFVGGFNGIFYNLAYLGVDCTVLTNVSTIIISGFVIFLLIKLFKQFLA